MSVQRLVLHHLSQTRPGVLLLIVRLSTADLASEQSVLRLGDLTVPQARLAQGCVLAPKANGVGLRITDNPWTGTDPMIVGAIRERLGSSRAPDAPIFTAAEAAEFRRRWAVGIAEGYVAVYIQEGGNLVVVYGLRFNSPDSSEQRVLEASMSMADAMNRITVGPLVATVRGRTSTCERSIHQYLTSLVQ